MRQRFQVKDAQQRIGHGLDEHELGRRGKRGTHLIEIIAVDETRLHA